MTQHSDNISFSRKIFLENFIDRMYHQRNINKIAVGESLSIPTNRFYDFIGDLNVILGKSIVDTLTESGEI